MKDAVLMGYSPSVVAGINAAIFERIAKETVERLRKVQDELSRENTKSD